MGNETKIKISSNRNFGLIFSLFFLIIALWNFRGNFQEIKILPFCFSIIFFTLGLLNSKYLTPLNYYPFGLFGHYNSRGYQLVAENLFEKLNITK